MSGEDLDAASELAAIGYFGKVPVRGDFVQRRLPRSFLDPWDDWLQGAVAASKSQLGDGWLDSYLTSPIWRFALSAGICGDVPVAGVLMPSVDSVGRYYPMTIVLLQPRSGHPFAFAARAQPWFAAAEEAILGCLDDGFELSALDDRLGGLADLSAGWREGDARIEAMPEPVGGGLGFHVNGAAVDRWFPDAYGGLLDCILRDRFARYSLWWTAGSDRVPAGLRMYGGFPAEVDFADFLGAAAP